MTYLTSAVLAASFALSASTALASHIESTDIEGSTRLTMKECLSMQAAKNDGASRADMKKACQWTTQEYGTDILPGRDVPRAMDTTPYGALPGTATAPW